MNCTVTIEILIGKCLDNTFGVSQKQRGNKEIEPWLDKGQLIRLGWI